MDGTLLKYDTKLTRYKFQFYTSENMLTNFLTPSAWICLRDLHLKNVVFIIGLNFIFRTFHGCSFSPHGLQFAASPFLPYTSQPIMKCTKTLQIPSNTCNCDSTGKCNCLTLDYNHLDIDIIDEIFFDALFLDEELDFSNLVLVPTRLYNLLSSGNLEIKNIISTLDKEDIIGETPPITLG